METIENDYNELKEVLKTYMSSNNLALIDEYFADGLKIYEGMKRLTGEDYFCHPLRVAKSLALLKMDTLTIGCALIHEALTLEKLTEEEVKEKYGEDVLTILLSISKLSHLKRTFKNNDNEDKYRRIVVGLSENPVSLFIKLADRLDNLKTVYVHDEEHIKDIIDETEKIFIPIAHRLGIKTMKSELEDLCLRFSDKEGYNEVLEKINASREELENSLYKMRDEIIDILNEHEIKYEIVYRVKSVRGIYNKLKAGKKWNNIYDLLGLRVLVEKVEECYLLVGLIHSRFRPLPKRFKDYIANPKNNMYQSLHTTVFGVDNRLYEIQIRTYEMNEVAEKGVASHWSYKEKTDGSKTSELEKKLALFRTLIEVNDAQGNTEFFKDLNTNLDKEFIYIFTPKGDIIELPKDSTPIDFAYKIHSQIGDSCVGAMVNGKMESLDYTLQDGDIVDLKTQKGKSPSKEWLNFVKTDTAKARIRSYFYKKDKDISINTGREVLISEIKKLRNYSVNDLLNDSVIEKLIEDMKVDSFDEIAIGISTYKYTPNVIISKLIDIVDPKEEENSIEKLLSNRDKIKIDNQGKILIAGYSDILTNLASCCHPILGDEIIGYITKGNGVTIHRKDCKTLDSKSQRLIEASWSGETTEKFLCTLKLFIDSNNENLIDIITVATKTDAIIISLDNMGSSHNFDIYELKLKVKNKESLERFMNELNTLKFVNKIER